MSDIVNTLRVWQDLKQKEDGLKNERHRIESELVKMLHLGKGTNKFDDVPVVIVCGDEKKWDQEKLKALAPTIEYFPFKIEYKEDSKGIKWTMQNAPAVWAQLLPALTVKPRKPSFQIKGEKGEEEESE